MRGYSLGSITSGGTDWCRVAGCGRESHCRAMCGKHYRRWLRHGDVEHVEKVREHPPVCLVFECDTSYYAKGVCRRHYDAIRRGWVDDPFAEEVAG